MTISETDLRLLKSERMTDYTDGGGKMTGVEVQDGLVNNIFNDISQLDRTYGRVSLRKVYMGVLTDNTDTYLGSHVILTDPPDDVHVNVTLFTTGSWTDERLIARNRIESYSVQGPESRWVLYGLHIIGQRAIRAFSLSNAGSFALPSTDPSPNVGDVLMLSTEKAGYTPAYQYVRMTKLTSRTTQKFTDGNGDYYKDIIVFEIASPLRYDFTGADIIRASIHGSPTLIRNTLVADAAQYFGVKKIRLPLALGDLSIKVDNPYGVLVPSGQSETPLVDCIGGSEIQCMKLSGAANSLTASATLTGSVAPDYFARLYLPRGFMPGSLALSILGAAYRDNGVGALVPVAGFANYTGSADYASGEITIFKTAGWTGAVSATASPGAPLYGNSHTDTIAISINNRQYNYVHTLSPVPSPGALLIDYRAMGKWIRLQDNGLGQLTGLAGTGSGSIDYVTGSLIVTLGALPDINSSVLFSWASPVGVEIATGDVAIVPPIIAITLANKGVTPGTLHLSWYAGASPKTATDDSHGNLTGDGIGTIIYASGEIKLRPTLVPSTAHTIEATYDYGIGDGAVKTMDFHPNRDGGGFVELNLGAAVKPGSIRINYNMDRIIVMVTKDPPYCLVDNGSGYLKIESGPGATPDVVLDTSLVNYQTGRIYFPVNFGTGIKTYNATQGIWIEQIGSFIFYDGTLITVSYRANLGADTHVIAESGTLPALVMALSPRLLYAVVPGSVRFTWGGKTFIDRDGVLYMDVSASTGSGISAGGIDYATGHVTLNNYASISGNNTLSLLSMLLTYGDFNCVGAYFHTPASPIATGSLYLRATAFTGQALTFTCDFNGAITGAEGVGSVDWESGVVAIEFGKYVLEADASWAWPTTPITWADASHHPTEPLLRWRPLPVEPATIRYDTVLVSYIPLDADILGVDTVRLPQDGRVPLYRVGNVGVVHNTQTLTLQNPAIAGAVYDCERVLLSYAKVFDANELIVPTAKYTVDLDAGTVTMANPLDLTGYVQPLKIEHRIEDMALITDVQITGQVQLMKPIRHAYPANTSYLSSALVISDLQARYTGLFDQGTWTSVWSDVVIGSASNASYNDVLYPLELTNAGVIQERWALVFTGSTAFNCYGEYSGLVAQGTTGQNFEPDNPITSVPYFSINHAGWGTGWASGNVLRFNTVAANYPLWLARTTLQSDPATYTDNFKIQIRGDAN